ncbi:MAG: hypothetical protein WD249_03600 [Gaiellaceae bacterium]
MFLAHQGAQSPSILEGFLETAAAEYPDWPVAATVFLPRYAPTTSADIVSRFQSGARYVLADPETHRMLDPFADRGRGRHHIGYLQESDPRANRQRFVDAVLRAQVDAGADAVISPWLTHGTLRTSTHLRATLRFAELAVENQMVGDREVLFGVAVTENIVADDEERGELIDDLVDLPNGNIYLRIQVTPPTSFGQYATRPVLLGMREIARALEANGRRVIYPQMGLAGWLALPDGGLGFGSGISASMQRFVAPTSGFGRPLEWYFLPQLLGFVLRSEVPDISAIDGYEACQCPYCENLEFGVGAGWVRDDAGLHYLWWCARLAHEVTDAANPPAALRDQLEASREFWNAIQGSQVLLDERSVPRHLAVWSAATTA